MDHYKQDLVRHLSQFITDNRWELFQRVVSMRTRYISVGLEDIYQSQNASAVLRTCDCTGIQDVHVIENRNEYDINPDVTLGSDQWLTIHYHQGEPDNTAEAISDLKQKGYRIVATSPRMEAPTPESFDPEEGKAVFLFGTELNGLSEKALELADEFIRIPMTGFTESFNISVSAAIILYQVRKTLEGSSVEWRLGDDERTEILLQWLRASIHRVELIEQGFQKKYRSDF